MINNPPIPPVDRFRKFGAWNATDSDQVGGAGSALANLTNYQASKDGFVLAWNSSTGSAIEARSDSGSVPVTIRATNGRSLDGDNKSITMPVRKGDYWQIKNALNIYFLPLSLDTVE